MDQQQMEGTKNNRNGTKHSLRGDFFNVVFDGRTQKHAKICPVSYYGWNNKQKWFRGGLVMVLS